MQPFAFSRLLTRALLDCATAAHEAAPQGVPMSYDWATHGVIRTGPQPPAGYTHVTGWGQCFPVRPGGPAWVSVRSVQTWARLAGVWHQAQSSNPEGGVFAADYSGNESTALAVDFEGVMRAGLFAGHALHFWASPRNVWPAGADALAVLFEAKADVAGTVLAGAGLDWWLSADAPYPNNVGAGEGQLALVSTEWDWYGFALEAAPQPEKVNP